MLVLLIVFMVTAPLLSVGVPVNLPKAQAQSLQTDTTPLTISVNAQGVIFIQEQEVALADIIPRLNAIGEGGTQRRIYVRGDAQVAYGRMAQLVAHINAAGFTRMALVTQTPQTPQ
ncbi:MAG: protein TolR [Alphaproteobacteria bacterium]|nr:protein TolR [Alphaproteobacteria bacterium]MBE8220023.1 protein TolR [Alphaproteobacteria bacterium]